MSADFKVSHGGAPVPSSLLDNQDVVQYLEDLGALNDRAVKPASDRTDTPEFRTGIVALDEGLAGHDAPGTTAPMPQHPSAGPGLRPAPVESADDWPGTPSGELEPEGLDVPETAPATMALFLIGMTLVGAAAAALVFRDPLFRLLGW